VATEKRARKKQYRDQRQAAAQAAWRRRRLIRLTAVVVVIVILFALAFTIGAGDNSKKKPAAAKSSPPPSAAAIACGGSAPPPAQPKKYDNPPEDILEPGADYSAVIHTSCGDIKLDLLEDEAPTTVNNFVFLAREGFYDGLTWHRIVQNFVIQGGDPKGTGEGGPGYEFKDELPAKSNVYVYGAVAMANSGPDTNGSQFFIVVHKGTKDEFGEPAGLQPLYSYFGVTDKSSFDVLDQIAKIPTVGGEDPSVADRPLQTIYIESIDVAQE
jgi:cyclophilin family peptidyl-prolyl cis-trans isomerase